MTERVRVTITDGVADVRLDRPDKLNALDFAMFEALVRTGRELRYDKGLRAVVLSGEGRSFCAGLDVASFAFDAGKVDALLHREEGELANMAQASAWVWTEIPVPVIAAITGHCFGGGLQIALGADIRLCAPDAELAVMEVKWGLVPDMTGIQRLRELVRLDVAKSLAFTGRKLSAEDAVRIGLATEVVEDPRAAALTMAREIAQKSPGAIRAAKRLFETSLRVPLAEALQLEAVLQRRLLGSKNQLEAVQSNMQRRPPKFDDPMGEG